ncbi:MAG: acyl-CoA dehydrogenase family protein [Hyphomicrobiaceae bacterium]
MLAQPNTATRPTAGAFVLIPRVAEGRNIIYELEYDGHAGDAQRRLVLEKCQLDESAVVFQSEDIGRFGQETAVWGWGSYTAVYLGVAGAAYEELLAVVKGRQPPGYAQPLAYHPDIRRQVAILSAQLESARMIMYRAAWLHDSEGPTEEASAALFRAKYVVGEAAAAITRTALTLAGAHGIFKGNRLELLFRDGAPAGAPRRPRTRPPWTLGIRELGLDPADVLPPIQPRHQELADHAREASIAGIATLTGAARRPAASSLELSGRIYVGPQRLSSSARSPTVRPHAAECVRPSKTYGTLAADKANVHLYPTSYGAHPTWKYRLA